jgi:hypothetical protein
MNRTSRNADKKIMKTQFTWIFLVVLFLSMNVVQPAEAEILQELWNKYSALENGRDRQSQEMKAQDAKSLDEQAENQEKPSATPGRIIGTATPEMETAFNYPWKVRSVTYELHVSDAGTLARAVHGIALFTRDVDKTLPREKFISGVLGFHYSTQQICDWINAVTAGTFPGPELNELHLLGILLQDDVITVRNSRFAPVGVITHVLAAAPGKKRSYDENLRHERLHTFWDEDSAFRQKAEAQWNALTKEQQAEEIKKLGRYTQDNIGQLIEEWAVHQSELSKTAL